MRRRAFCRSCRGPGAPALIVSFHVGVENRLHLVDGLEPGAPAFDAEVLVEQRSVQPFDNSVRLRAFDARGSVLDLLDLEEQLVGVLVGSAAELATIVGQDHLDLGVVRLEGRDDVVVIRCTAVIGSFEE
jgi:hypothetical protein